ncbi:hypothetical protein ABIE45_004303 [Methylobacterium sp. OAE515]
MSLLDSNKRLPDLKRRNEVDNPGLRTTSV